MGPVSLYVPDSVPKGFLRLVADKIVSLVPQPVDPYALFDRSDTCACSSRDFLTLHDRRIVVKANHHGVFGFPMYALPEDCTFQETVVVVAWLMRHHLKTFTQRVGLKSFDRTLASNKWFSCTILDNHPCCVSYLMTSDPAFMLSSIVVSPLGSGPTLESSVLAEIYAERRREEEEQEQEAT